MNTDGCIQFGGMVVGHRFCERPQANLVSALEVLTESGGVPP